MKTLEDKEIEFKEYVIDQIQLALGVDGRQIQVRMLAHTLIQDFKEEVEGFNKAMCEELEKTREELENANNKLSRINDIIGGLDD